MQVKAEPILEDSNKLKFVALVGGRCERLKAEKVCRIVRKCTNFAQRKSAQEALPAWRICAYRPRGDLRQTLGNP